MPDAMLASPPPSLGDPKHSSGYETPPESVLPHLPYSLRNHTRNIAIIWSLLVLDAAIMPFALFYPLWYATSLQPTYIIDITTSVFGVVCGLEWCFRTWQLLKREDLRPLGGKKFGFDFFHISYTTAYGIGLIELAWGAAPKQPLLRLLAMPSASFILFFGAELLLFAILSALNVRSRFRISSQPKGALIRPGIYMVIEDVIAVGTGSGRAYREAMNARYEASPLFRRMLFRLNMFWAVPALFVGAGVTAVVLSPQVPQTVAYGIGYGVPPIWTTIWIIITVKRVQTSLRAEKEAWNKEGIV